MKIYYLLIAILLTTSCEKEASEIKLPPQESKQILSAFFTDDLDTLLLFISNSVSTTGRIQSAGIKNADVGLYLDNERVLSFESLENGFYQVPKGGFEFVVGKEYELRSVVDGFPSISAKETFLPEVKPDSIVFIKPSSNSFDSQGFVRFSFQDLVGDDYYGFMRAAFFVDSMFVGAESFGMIGSESIYPTISDKFFDKQKVVGSIIVDGIGGIEEIGNSNTKIKVSIVHISKAWHTFENFIEYNDLDNIEFGSFIYTKNIPSNVNGGYGIFGLGNVGSRELNF